MEGLGQFHPAEFGRSHVSDFGVALEHKGPRHSVGEGEGIIGVGRGEVVSPGNEWFGIGHGTECGGEGEVKMGGQGSVGNDEVGGLNERGEPFGEQASVLREVSIGLAIIEDFAEAEQLGKSGGKFR